MCSVVAHFISNLQTHAISTHLKLHLIAEFLNNVYLARFFLLFFLLNLRPPWTTSWQCYIYISKKSVSFSSLAICSATFNNTCLFRIRIMAIEHKLRLFLEMLSEMECFQIFPVALEFILKLFFPLKECKVMQEDPGGRWALRNCEKKTPKCWRFHPFFPLQWARGQNDEK